MRFDITQVIFVDSDFFPSGAWVYGYYDGYLLAGEFYTLGKLPQVVIDFISGKKSYSYNADHVSYECYYEWSERL